MPEAGKIRCVYAALGPAAIAILIAINGFFALCELTVVSSRRSRLQIMAEHLRPGARAALALAETPGNFLSTVQIGITLVAILTGVISDAAGAAEMAEHLGLTLPAERDYDTVAGFVLSGFPQLPDVGQTMTAGGWQFEVAKLQGRRVDRLHVSPLPSGPDESTPPDDSDGFRTLRR